MSGHLRNKYIPLLYLNPTGFPKYNDRTFPGYIAAYKFTRGDFKSEL